jgi:uncharacterized protein
MPLLVNLRHLETEDQDLDLHGELPVAELDLGCSDDLVVPAKPLLYRLTVQLLEDSLLVQGSLRLPLQCQCARCLKPFEYPLEFPRWTLLLPLEGEEKVAVENDCIDLTPHVREDILLELPQHPLCGKDCRGLPQPVQGEAVKTSDPGQASSAWAALDKLNIEHLN